VPTLSGFLWSTSIGAVVATPATLVIIRLSENGDNPFKSFGTIVKIAAAWWLGVAIGSVLGHYVFFAFSPVFVLTVFPAVVGQIFNLFFGEGFWRGTWWAFWSLGLLATLPLLAFVAHFVLGRHGLGLL